MKRRDILKGMAAMSVSPMLTSCTQEEEVATKRRLDKVGIQLYTVRDQMAADVPGTLAKLADIGYQELEFAGYFDHSPQEIRTFLDDLGLSAPSAHTLLQPMSEIPEQLIEAALTVGHEYIVLGWLRPEERASLDDYRRHVKVINVFAEQCHLAGLKFAYHNHDFEFETLDGMRPMDLLLAETDPSRMQVELDLYWITKAGADPFAFFKQHPGRFPLCHVKDMAADGSFADVGAGEINFGEIFAESRLAGFRHYYVERDDATDPLASAANSFSAVSELEF